jgi:hypothetical protein
MLAVSHYCHFYTFNAANHFLHIFRISYDAAITKDDPKNFKENIFFLFFPWFTRFFAILGLSLYISQ